MIAMLAAAAALSFAPPLDRALRYEVTERRPEAGGAMLGATLTEEIVFAADPNGYVMTIRTTGYRNTLPPEQSGGFEVAMKPMLGTVVRIHLSHGGVPERVVDGAASWSAMLASLRAMIATHPPDQEGPARKMLAALEATPPDARDARLIAAADDVLATHLPPIAVGAQVTEEGGTIARTADDDGQALYRETTVREAAGRTLATDATIAVSRGTGLVTRCLRRTVIAAGAAAAPQPIGESETVLIP